MELGRNVKEYIDNSISEYVNSIWDVVYNSVSDSTSYNVRESIRGLVIRPVLISIQPINNGR